MLAKRGKKVAWQVLGYGESLDFGNSRFLDRKQ
jgi:hypothetical protein